MLLVCKHACNKMVIAQTCYNIHNIIIILSTTKCIAYSSIIECLVPGVQIFKFQNVSLYLNVEYAKMNPANYHYCIYL